MAQTASERREQHAAPISHTRQIARRLPRLSSGGILLILGLIAALVRFNASLSPTFAHPLAPLLRLATTLEQRNPWAWWHGSIGLYRMVLAMMGFAIERITRNRFPCRSSEMELTTVVARRAVK